MTRRERFFRWWHRNDIGSEIGLLLGLVIVFAMIVAAVAG